MPIQTLLTLQHDKELLHEMINILFRTSHNKRLAQAIDELLNRHKLGDFFSSTQKALFWIFQHSTKNIPDISIPFLKEYIKQESRKFLVDSYEIDEYLKKLEFQDKKVMIRFLEPMALNEENSLKTLEKYMQILTNKSVFSVLMDIFCIEPKIYFLNKSRCLEHLENKLSIILRQSIKYSKEQGCKKLLCFEVAQESFEITFTILNKIMQKEEFLTAKIGFSFKIEEFNTAILIEKVILLASELISLGREKITIRIEMNRLEDLANTHFQTALKSLLLKKNEPFIDVIINSFHSNNLAIVQEKIVELKLEKMVQLENFMGFNTFGKHFDLLYFPIACFDDFIYGVDYLLEKIKPQKSKNVFYNFDSKNIIFLSIFCNQEKSLENILEKISLAYEKASFLDLELLIEEELFYNEPFMEELKKSVQSLLLCLDSSLLVDLNSKNYIRIESNGFLNNIGLIKVKDTLEAVAFIQSEKKACSYKIYTQYCAQEEQFYNFFLEEF